MLSWQSILRIGCQTERLAQLRAFAIIGVILLQRRSRITMPPCEYFTLFYIQCGVYTEFGIEPSCLMMINSPSFAQIKNTRTYPSILWIYAMFLLSSNSLEPASHYADDAVKNFERLSIKDSDYDDALLIYGIAEIGLFALNLDKNHLKNARNVAKKFEKKKCFPKNVQVHYDQLTQEIAKYNRFKI